MAYRWKVGSIEVYLIWQTCIFNVTVALYDQPTEIQDGHVRHLEFGYICTFNETVVFHERFSLFPSNLVRICPILKKEQPIF
jgi:hypothetical protein